MKLLKWLSILSVILSTAAWADDPCEGRGGGEVPIPFTFNQKVELADHETYLLQGTVTIDRGYTFFEVDLDRHPWLANALRRRVPFYPLEGDPTFWQKYAHHKIRASFIAHGRPHLNVAGLPSYLITLGLLNDPVLVCH